MYQDGLSLMESHPHKIWGPAEKRLKHLRRHCPKDGLVLDAGCGTGWASHALLRSGYKIISVDLSDASLAKASRLLLGNSSSHAQLVKCSLTHLPFRSGAFEAVFSFDVLEHIPGCLKAVAELDRVAASEGRVVVTVPNKFGLWALVNDYLIDRVYLPLRSLAKRILKGQYSQHKKGIESFHENFYTHKEWVNLLSRVSMVLVESANLEFACPLLAKLGYERTSRLSFRDVEIANYLPASIASEWILVFQKKQRH